jgi:hypothetical protein
LTASASRLPFGCFAAAPAFKIAFRLHAPLSAVEKGSFVGKLLHAEAGVCGADLLDRKLRRSIIETAESAGCSACSALLVANRSNRIYTPAIRLLAAAVCRSDCRTHDTFPVGLRILPSSRTVIGRISAGQ